MEAGGAMKKCQKDPKEEQALARFGAVSFIKQQRRAGWPLSQCLKAAARQPWPKRFYAVSTLEEWYYLYQQGGFEALKPKGRTDRGRVRSLGSATCHRLQQLREEHPDLTVRSLVRQLLKEGLLEPGGFSLSSIYRYLHARGLDARSLRAREHLEPGAGPQKAFECAFANELWMVDIMHGPTLKLSAGRPIKTRLFALIDDCSRLCPAAAYYASESLDCLLDLLRQGVQSRGIPLKLYSDNGKVFTSGHLKVVCANLDIQLLHARPYHSWSKGKIERFFKSVQEDFQQRLAFEPVSDLGELNQRLDHWIEEDYHQRRHSALEGSSPAERFRRRCGNLRTPPEDLDRLFRHQVTRRVRRDATFSLDGNLWEVSPSLRGEKIEVHYDPFNTGDIEVYVRGNYCQKARPLDKQFNSNSSNNYEGSF